MSCISKHQHIHGPDTCARCSNLGDTALRRCAFPCLSVPGAKSPPRGDLSFAGLVAVESWLASSVGQSRGQTNRCPGDKDPTRGLMLRCFPVAVMGLRTGEVAFSCLPAAVLQLLAGEVALRPSETSPMSEKLCPLRRLLAGTVGVDGACKARFRKFRRCCGLSLRPSQPSQVGLPARFALPHLCFRAQPPG